MPWLIKNKEDVESSLFFVHVPRTGGTSLMHHFDVPKKCIKGRSSWGRMGMRLFFYRYKQLESTNFPIFTNVNAFFISVLLLSLYIRCWMPDEYSWLSLCLTASSITALASLSFVFTAPVIGRVPFIRRLYLIFIHHLLFRFMESVDWCTGTNNRGYMMHLTANKLLNYGYITEGEMNSMCSFAIVRNPYSRMVSMYMYNRFGRFESFRHFVKSWYDEMQPYLTTGETEEWHTPCHQIPQFEFTHIEGKQTVTSIVKQEDLRFLKKSKEEDIPQDCSIRNLPPLVHDALVGMPHTNKRTTAKKWYEYFDQETLELTYKMYKKDFEVFGYPPALAQRPDLKSPASTQPGHPAANKSRTWPSKPKELTPLQVAFRRSMAASRSPLVRLSEQRGPLVFLSDQNVDGLRRH